MQQNVSKCTCDAKWHLNNNFCYFQSWYIIIYKSYHWIIISDALSYKHHFNVAACGGGNISTLHVVGSFNPSQYVTFYKLIICFNANCNLKSSIQTVCGDSQLSSSLYTKKSVVTGLVLNFLGRFFRKVSSVLTDCWSLRHFNLSGAVTPSEWSRSNKSSKLNDRIRCLSMPSRTTQRGVFKSWYNFPFGWHLTDINI